MHPRKPDGSFDFEAYWATVSPEKERKFFEWLEDMGTYWQRAERRGWRQLWAWVKGELC